MEEVEGIKPEVVAENNRLLNLKNKLQIELAQMLFPGLSTREAFMRYMDEEDAYKFSEELGLILEEDSKWYVRLEKDFENAVKEILVILKERVGYKE